MSDKDNVESISPSINLDKAVDIINTVDNTNIEIDKHCDNIPCTDDILKAAKDIKDRMDNIKQTNSKNVDNNSPDSNIQTDVIKTTDNDNDKTLNGKQMNSNNTDNDTDSNLTGKEKGYKNLIPLNERTKEEQRELAKKGGKRSGEVRKQKKTAKELLETLLSTDMSEDMIADVLGGSSALLGDNKTAYNVMLTKMLQVACAGDTKAFVALRDTVGDKPADKQEITADIMTDADRKVIENIKKRIVNSAPID